MHVQRKKYTEIHKIHSYYEDVFILCVCVCIYIYIYIYIAHGSESMGSQTLGCQNISIFCVFLLRLNIYYKISLLSYSF